jgi:hypothetical protein
VENDDRAPIGKIIYLEPRKLRPIIMSVFFALANNRVSKITHFQF